MGDFGEQRGYVLEEAKDSAGRDLESPNDRFNWDGTLRLEGFGESVEARGVGVDDGPELAPRRVLTFVWANKEGGSG